MGTDEDECEPDDYEPDEDDLLAMRDAEFDAVWGGAAEYVESGALDFDKALLLGHLGPLIRLESLTTPTGWLDFCVLAEKRLGLGKQLSASKGPLDGGGLGLLGPLGGARRHGRPGARPHVHREPARRRSGPEVLGTAQPAPSFLATPVKRCCQQRRPGSAWLRTVVSG